MNYTKEVIKDAIMSTLATFGIGVLCYINLVLWSIIFE